MNSEKEIAKAVVEAQKLREASYIAGTGRYKLDMEECLMKTCKKNNCSTNLWFLLNLAIHWWNDIQLWAEDILSDKDIPRPPYKHSLKKPPK